MLRVFLVLASLYAVLCLVAALFQRRLVYFPSRTLWRDPGDLGLAFEDVTLRAADGVALHAWYLPREDALGELLFLHGNAGNVAGRLEVARAFLDAGLSVLLPDYRGYGRSGGSPSESGLIEDAETAHRWLRERRGADPSRILVYGESLGGAVAVALAARRPVAGLVLEATFASLADVGAAAYPWLPVRLLLLDRFDSETRLAGLDLPVLLVHSPDDEVVPFAQARRLRAATGGRARLLVTAGAHAGGGFLARPEWRATVARFAREALAPAPSGTRAGAGERGDRAQKR